MTTIWITGAAGFIGTHLASFAKAKGAQNYGIGHGNPISSLAQNSFDGWLNADIDSSNLRALQQQSGPPAVIYHLAGGSAVAPSIAAPAEDFQRTVLTSVRLFDWVRTLDNPPRVVCASSAAVYGSAHIKPIAEYDTIKPYSPYGFHKRMMELVAESFVQTFGLRVTIVRLFSIYGPGLRKQLLWDIARRLKSDNKFLQLGGSGNEVRDWLYVKDAVRLLWMAASGPTSGDDVVNGCTGEGTTVREIAEYVATCLGHSGSIEFSGNSRPGDPQYLVGNPARAKSIGFEPSYALGDGLSETAVWLRDEMGK